MRYDVVFHALGYLGAMSAIGYLLGIGLTVIAGSVKSQLDIPDPSEATLLLEATTSSGVPVRIPSIRVLK